MTTLDLMERRIRSYRPSTQSQQRSAALYASSNILQLPFSGLKQDFMVVLTREALMYRDPRVAAAGIEVRTGRKWKAEEALKLRQRELMGNVARGCAGFSTTLPCKVCLCLCLCI